MSSIVIILYMMGAGIVLLIEKSRGNIEYDNNF
jgi:hypothetical protein